MPFGFPPRSSVARGTWSGTRARLMPSTTTTCFLVFLVISSPAESDSRSENSRENLITQNQRDPIVERQLAVFDEHDLPALGEHRRDHLVHRIVHDAGRGWIVDVQIQLPPL